MVRDGFSLPSFHRAKVSEVLAPNDVNDIDYRAGNVKLVTFNHRGNKFNFCSMELSLAPSPPLSRQQPVLWPTEVHDIGLHQSALSGIADEMKSVSLLQLPSFGSTQRARVKLNDTRQPYLLA